MKLIILFLIISLIIPVHAQTQDQGKIPGDSFYSIDLFKNTCTCPHFMHRMKKLGGDCKHLKAVKETVTDAPSEDFDEIISFIKGNVFVDSIELIEKYGEKKINELIKNGELIEEHGKVRIL